MLPRWLESLLTPCPRHLRAMGYLRELLDIKAGLRRWGWAWEPHFERTRGILRQALALCPQRRRAVILGSGWLNDVPLDELAAAFREVVLVDLVHPLRTRWRVRQQRNVRLVATDLTGTLAEVYRVADDPRAPLPRVRPELYCDDPEVDLVASVNILSQLPWLPAEYLLRRGEHANAAIFDFAQDVVRAHLDYLRRLPGVVALIADTSCLTVTTAGAIVRRTSTVYGVEVPWDGERWIWRLVPRKRAWPHHGLHREVVGVPDLARAPRAPGT
jgi:hypothetical protein